jgi:hypothetical protein
MNNDNKKRTTIGAKRIALAAYALLTIAVCAGVWNFCPETAVKIGAGLLSVANAISIVAMWKKSGEDE